MATKYQTAVTIFWRLCNHFHCSLKPRKNIHPSLIPRSLSLSVCTTESLYLACADSSSGSQFPSLSPHRWCHCDAMCQLNKSWQGTGLWDFGACSTDKYSHIPLFSVCPLLLTLTQYSKSLGNETELQLHTHLVWAERFWGGEDTCSMIVRCAPIPLPLPGQHFPLSLVVHCSCHYSQCLIS